ncbi:hypothetical protein I4U23_005042 [Adineta vaga]|nr:hypothetical protein I4U23_005042 [Adineta vaga]
MVSAHQYRQMLYDPNFGVSFSQWAIPIAMSMPPLFPFVCLSTLDDLHAKLQKVIHWRNRRIVVPITGTQLRQVPMTNSRRHNV